MFHSALWKLIRLKWRGGFRRLLQGLKTVRGLLHAGLVLAMVGWGVFSMLVAGVMSHADSAGAIATFDRNHDFAQIGLFVFVMWTIVFSTGEATVFFTASEVAFLFPAPLHRRQLLTYKLIQSLQGLVWVSLFLSLMLARSPALWFSGFTGLVLTLCFLQLLTMNVAFLRQVLKDRWSVRARWLIGVIVLIVVAVAAGQALQESTQVAPTEFLRAFRESSAGKLLLAPFNIFADMLFPGSLAVYALSASVILLVDAGLLVGAYRLDGLSLEAALAISEKLTAKIRSIQQKGPWRALETSGASHVRRRLPQLPFWYGAGPIVWQRVTTNLRASLKMIAMLTGAACVAGGIAVTLHIKHPDQPFAAAGAAIGILGYVSFLTSLSLPNDVERVAYLKSLPLTCTAIVLGELLGFVAIVSLVQGLLLIGLCGLLPTIAPWLLLAAGLTVPLNFVLFGVDKLVFYAFPTRMAKGAPGDFQHAGRQMFYMFMKMLVLMTGLAVIGMAVIPGAVLRSPVIAVVPAVIVLLLECACLVPALSWGFRRFDPGVDTPV